MIAISIYNFGYFSDLY